METEKTSPEDEPAPPQDDLLPCPLCKQPLQIGLNRLAHCSNICRQADSVAEFNNRSCPMASNAIFMPVGVWQALNTRAPQDEVSAALKELRKLCKGQLTELKISQPRKGSSRYTAYVEYEEVWQSTSLTKLMQKVREWKATALVEGQE